tara:strand:+ start:2040 stop:2276 length:237 start_codon:yes stop_codon:yes gene_type:complete
MNFITNLFSRNTISSSPKKLIIKTLDTQFEINENQEQVYYKLLTYSVNNTDPVNDYKTSIRLIDSNKTIEFFTYSKVI